MLGTYFVWVHVGSSSLVWAHLGSGSSERIYLPGQGRPESKIDPNGIVFKHFEHSVQHFAHSFDRQIRGKAVRSPILLQMATKHDGSTNPVKDEAM